MAAKQYVYRFGPDEHGVDCTEGGADDAWCLGGKGANLAEMARMGLPVPAGFTITCQTCVSYSEQGVWPAGSLDEIQAAITDLERRSQKRLGNPENPLLVSVRSGAPISMPGMMDTVLNVGLNPETVAGLATLTNNLRFAWDSYRRFIQMFSNVVLGIPLNLFEDALADAREQAGVASDAELKTEQLQALVVRYLEIFDQAISYQTRAYLETQTGSASFPTSATDQVLLAIQAVFASWDNERARLYRKQYNISDALGTAVNVQAMVFGNRGMHSATGVAFTRNPATGIHEPYGDYLINAQGEDVVAGIRNTCSISNLKNVPELAKPARELYQTLDVLEQHYRDMCDIEFTIECKKLWMLQTRIGKRSAQAALKIAVDMVQEGILTREEAILRLEPQQLDQVLHPHFDPSHQIAALAYGLNASPGAAVGEIVFSSDDAVARVKAGYKTILVRPETNPDDFCGMSVAEGILTSHGGKTSHAAVIARGMGTPCVCGAEALHIDIDNKLIRVAGTSIELHEGDVISIDGNSGAVVQGPLPLIESTMTPELIEVLRWADEIRLSPPSGKPAHVRANADTPADGALALKFGAEAIGLCRTEHMFLGERKEIIQTFIVNDSPHAQAQALKQLLAVQTDDFYHMLKIMNGRPVVIRLIDPPLHEFVDDPRMLALQLAALEGEGGHSEEIAAMQTRLRRIDSLSEVNPMLGLRGVRLSFVYPDLAHMQVRAIVEATARLVQEGFDPKPEIMIPLVSLLSEHVHMRRVIEELIATIEQQRGISLDIPIGTMIELPRACFIAGDIARYADFFCFGTNDLTQTSFGFSRDDAEGKFIPLYLQQGLMDTNPFEHIDEVVLNLVEMAHEQGIDVNPHIHTGVCGEHGGDPASIVQFFNEAQLDYVSCSPYRVPVARLAAAQAVLQRAGTFTAEKS
ncbi:pyruvate, phosphate dikinase [Collinsella sp. zg1085]|uniref:pyruvate, phosphate dikinase n=1 Tax=Collinsella sp. zg1085 TaxID=2844380 RepID=UPI001C0D418F|nr:pyruvate, phosphate dikinase [Collinsella sp. zg1085]QWT17045.1 pyruvate, phosphate dikinase [Collinsella sp. zg1085]